MLANSLARVAQLPRWAQAILLASCGALAALGQAPFGLPIVSLIGFACAMLTLSGPKLGLSPFWAGWVFGLGYFLITLQWLVSPFLVEPERHAWMAPFGLFFMAGGLSLFWGAAARVAAFVPGPISFATLLVVAELARGYLFTGFPWGLPAYVLVDQAFGQMAAWVGSYGLSFLFLLTAALLVTALRSSGLRRWIALFCALPGLMLTLLPAPAPATSGPEAAVIRLVQPNAPQHLKWDRAYMPIFFDRALKLTASETASEPELILWPESALPELLNYGEDALAEISRAAGEIPVLLGANRLDGVRLKNAAVLIDAKGQPKALYDKHHLVPFGEYMPLRNLMSQIGLFGLAAEAERGFWPGAGPELMDLGVIGKALPLICYEAVFPQDVRGAPERPDILVHMTNDAWFGTFSGPYQHLVQAQMRAIEMGLPLVRAANTGVSAMIDARGRITAALPLNEAGFLDVAIPVPRPETLYAQSGDWLIFVFCLLLFLGNWVRARLKSD